MIEGAAVSDLEAHLGAGNLPRVVVTLCLGLALTGCTSYDPEIVSGTADEIVVKAPTDANPGLLAADHCAEYDKDAALRGSEVIGRAVWFPADIRLFRFECMR